MLPKRPVLIFTALLVGLLLYSSPTAEGATSPSFTVYVTSNEIHGYEWPLGVEVTLLIDDPLVPGPVDYSDAQTVAVANWDPGQTWVQFVVPETFEIQPDQVITLMHDTTTKIHTVTNLAMSSVDPDTDIVIGTADPIVPITVWACSESGCVFRNEAADGSGDWIADFGNPGDEPGEDIFDIGPGTTVDAYEHDNDDDATAIQWRVPNPRFTVYVSWNGVHGYDWPLGEVVTLLIDDPAIGGPVDYSDAQTVAADWDPRQTLVEFVVPEAFDILPGHIVTLMHGTTTKIHTVTSLAVTSVDPATDIVVGTAGPGSDVWVDTCCSSRHEVANGSGDWSADFSTFGDEDFEQDTFDIGPGSGGQANQVDADGDGTAVDWRVPNPRFWVSPLEERVHGSEWPEGALVTLTINDPLVPGPVDYTDSQTVTSNPCCGTFVAFDLQGVFDVQPGHLVTLTDGVTTKEHTVTNLTVTGQDLDLDTVTGTADTGTDVDVNVCDESSCANRHEVADEFGDWTADFAAPGDEPGEEDTYDVVPGSQGETNQWDDGNDGTHVHWRVPNPSFTVYVTSNGVQGWDWEEGALVTLTIDDPLVPGPVDYTDDQTVTSVPCCGTMISFQFQGFFDVQPGHVVTLTDGVTVKTHTVTDLTVTAVDPDTDTVTGTADPATDVNVDICDESGCASRYEVANGLGDWSADFSTPGDEPGEEQTYDIVPGSQGWAHQLDDDGDATAVPWQVPNPHFIVWLTWNEVQGYEWPEGALVTLTIDDPGTGPGVDYTDSQIAGPLPWNPQQIGVNFQLQGLFDIQPGHIVTLTDGVTIKEHTVTDLTVTETDPDADIVVGTVDPGSDVWVDTCCSSRHEVANGSGDWTADFSTFGDEDFEQDTFDIIPGSGGQARQPDDDGDATAVQWRVPNPRFDVGPRDGQVQGYDWPEEALVTLTIDDPGTPEPVDYTDSQTVVTPPPWVPGQTWVNFGFWGTFDVQPGHLVTLTDGVTTKTHTVTSLTVTAVDPDTDTISGTADAGSDVWVDTCCSSRHEVANGSGDWSADFSTFGDEDFEQNTFDIVPGAHGQVNQVDADGDATVFGWAVFDPYFWVQPVGDQVEGYNWPEGALVTLTIDDPGTGPGVDYTDSQTVVFEPGRIWVRFDLQGIFDVQPGHIVTLSDGVATKEHTVTNLTVAGVDPDTDTVTGTADPDSDVWVQVWDGFGTQRHEVADGLGDWTADFSTPGDEPGEEGTSDIVPDSQGDAYQHDGDNDSTDVSWWVPNPRFQVWPGDDSVDGYGWPDGVEVTLTIDDPATGPGVDYTESKTVGRWPWGTIVNFNLGGIFDVQPGHVVTITDGEYIREHTVTSLAVTDVDPDFDTVTGTAEPGSDVGVSIQGPPGPPPAFRHEVADGSGNWTADFSVPGDEGLDWGIYDIAPGTDGTAAQEDADGDYTIVAWYVPNPRFDVWPGDDLVNGNDFAVGALVTLTIDDPGAPGPVDYTDTQLVTSGPLDTWVAFDLLGVFDVQPGHIVTLSDGVITKEHTVTSVALTVVDPDTDTVSGTADPASDIDVYACGKGCAYRHEVADGFGDWSADFSTPGDEPGEEGTSDIRPGITAYAVQSDADDDHTVVSWVDHDGDGIPDAQDPDDDNDGFMDEDENFMGTDPLAACAATSTSNDEDPDSLPTDFDDDQDTDVIDVLFFKSHILKSDPDPDYSVRFDFDEDGDVDIIDVLYLKSRINTSCAV